MATIISLDTMQTIYCDADKDYNQIDEHIKVLAKKYGWWYDQLKDCYLRSEMSLINFELKQLKK